MAFLPTSNTNDSARVASQGRRGLSASNGIVSLSCSKLLVTQLRGRRVEVTRIFPGSSIVTECDLRTPTSPCRAVVHCREVVPDLV